MLPTGRGVSLPGLIFHINIAQTPMPAFDDTESVIEVCSNRIEERKCKAVYVLDRTKCRAFSREIK